LENKFEIITFKDGEFSFPVNVSPTEDTIWLKQEEIALLFDRERTVILKHIRNIFKEKELDENSVCAKNAQTGPDGKTYYVLMYNLDVIISVGYRVKSKRGIIFRKWASSILKEYMLKNNECSECKEKIINLVERISKVEETQKHELVYQKGDKLKGYISIKRFLETAKQSIYIIDDYFDHSFDEVLKEINVNITIITDPKNTLDCNEIYKVKKTKSFHDRFIFVDGVGYHLGCSLKDIGNSLTVATRLESITLSDILKFVC